MKVDESFTVFHGHIDCQTAIDRLGSIPKSGAYLVRETDRAYVITYFDQNMDIKHVIINIADNTTLRKCNPQITSIKAAVGFISSLDSKKFAFKHGVPWQNFCKNPIGTIRAPNQCHVCENVIEDKKEPNHLSIHRVSYCDSCQDLVPHRSIYNHKVKCENRKSLLKCQFCDNFETRWTISLLRHIKEHNEKKPSPCQVCNKPFKSALKLEKHMQGHLGFVCDYCGKKYRSKGGIDQHVKLHHDIYQLQNGELITGYISYIPRGEMVMVKKKPNKPNKPKVLKCDKCEFTTVHRKSLSRHKLDTHEIYVLKSCPICGKTPKNQSGYADHMKWHNNKTSCTVCGKLVFNLKAHCHQAHEIRERSHFCSKCEKGFYTKALLNKHMQCHQDKTACKECGLKVRSLDYHMKTVHTPSEQKKFQCPDCGKGWISEKRLQKHRMNVHLKLRPYMCRYEECEYDFAYNDSGNRNAHERKVHGRTFTTAKEEKEKEKQELQELMQNKL